MASNVAAPKNTGGGGFVFEDDVCAWILVCMLVGRPPFDASLGPPNRIDFQTRVDGWFLDDLLITTVGNSQRHRFAVSVKSNPQFTATAAPLDFVVPAWQQWLGIGSLAFDKAQDFMVLATAPLSGAAASSVSGLVSKAAAADPNVLSGRLATPGWANEDERKMFESFRCPAQVETTGHVTDVDTSHLLQRLRFVQYDFGALVSEYEKSALELCRSCLRQGAPDEALLLWNLLRGIASELRPRSGTIALSGLVERLRGSVQLADCPDYRADWESLDIRSRSEASIINASIADAISVPRDIDVETLAATLGKHELVACLGTSGAGKSVVAKALFTQRALVGGRTLWLDARALDQNHFDAFEATLRLRNSLGELLAGDITESPLLLIDGIDRLFTDTGFRNVASLVLLARQSGRTAWRILAPCQTAEWQRVLDGLERMGLRVPWHSQELRSLRVSELEPVAASIPAIQPLFANQRIASVLCNLKVLDLVARRVQREGAIDASTLVGESTVAEWFWSGEVDRGTQRLSRARFARELALRQADQLTTSISIDSFDVADLGAPIESLISDHVCVQAPGDRIAFAHDLYADWARLRILLSHRDDLATFLRPRRESPLWHRALRLLAIYHLERPNGVEAWRALLAAFAGDDFVGTRDLVLEAPIFAVRSRRLLNAILPDLLNNAGALLRRLLARFLAFATEPDPRMMALARAMKLDSPEVRATYRSPVWPYWFGVLSFLHEHRVVLLEAASPEIARVVELWLTSTEPGATRRAEVAEMAILLGREACAGRHDFGGQEWQEEKERYYRCALLASPERPDEVAELALIAAERTVQSDSTSVCRRRRALFRGSGQLRQPWQDGPHREVDGAFRRVILEGSAILHLFRSRPAIAREVILAALIDEPSEEDAREHWSDRTDLDISKQWDWSPSLYTRGPFLGCLNGNFEEGLELIVRLADFAAERAEEHSRRERERGGFVGPFGGHESAEERVFMWNAAGTPPAAVQCALMALEQYFYLRLDGKQDITPQVQTAFDRCNSMAIVGTLCDVAKRERSLFAGPLRALLAAPEIHRWDIRKRSHGRGHLLIGVPRDEAFVRLAVEFNELIASRAGPPKHCRTLDVAEPGDACLFRHGSTLLGVDSYR